MPSRLVEIRYFLYKNYRDHIGKDYGLVKLPGVALIQALVILQFTRKYHHVFDPAQRHCPHHSCILRYWNCGLRTAFGGALLRFATDCS